MSQVSRRKMPPGLEDKILNLFVKALTEAKTSTETKEFIDDFFTPTEKTMLSKRFAVAFLLYKEIDISTIAKMLRVSTGTVSRIKIWLEIEGGGYRKIISRIIAKKQLGNLLVDLFETFRYSGLPPKYGNWKEWHKRKRAWKKELRDPFR